MKQTRLHTKTHLLTDTHVYCLMLAYEAPWISHAHCGAQYTLAPRQNTHIHTHHLNKSFEVGDPGVPKSSRQSFFNRLSPDTHYQKKKCKGGTQGVKTCVYLSVEKERWGEEESLGSAFTHHTLQPFSLAKVRKLKSCENRQIFLSSLLVIFTLWQTKYPKEHWATLQVVIQNNSNILMGASVKVG